MSTHTTEKLRRDADMILRAGLRAADPYRAVTEHVSIEQDILRAADTVALDLTDFDRIVVTGAGKGSAPMARALEDMLGERISHGIVCVKYDHTEPLQRIEIREAGHPVPDENGRRACMEIVDTLKAAGDRDLVISCISGGGSALLPAPVEPVTLEQKQELTRKLLAAGADISQINAVRKHLSRAKGGRLMAAAFPATVVNLALSDVIGDNPDTIASGPFVPDSSSFADAWEVLEQFNLLESVTPEILQVLQSGRDGAIPETPKHDDPIFRRCTNIIVGSNIQSLTAAKECAAELGYHTLILSSSLAGDTTEAAGFHTSLAREAHATGNPVPRPACILSGGETTVRVTGNGLGGRNQEFVLAMVEPLAEIPDAVVLSAGTDGTDGPTDAAGAAADTGSANRAAKLGLSPRLYLKENDSYHFFRQLNDLVITGPTRTNVMDMRIMLLS